MCFQFGVGKGCCNEVCGYICIISQCGRKITRPWPIPDASGAWGHHLESGHFVVFPNVNIGTVGTESVPGAADVKWIIYRAGPIIQTAYGFSFGNFANQYDMDTNSNASFTKIEDQQHLFQTQKWTFSGASNSSNGNPTNQVHVRSPGANIKVVPVLVYPNDVRSLALRLTEDFDSADNIVTSNSVPFPSGQDYSVTNSVSGTVEYFVSSTGVEVEMIATITGSVTTTSTANFSESVNHRYQIVAFENGPDRYRGGGCVAPIVSVTAGSPTLLRSGSATSQSLPVTVGKTYRLIGLGIVFTADSNGFTQDTLDYPDAGGVVEYGGVARGEVLSLTPSESANDIVGIATLSRLPNGDFSFSFSTDGALTTIETRNLQGSGENYTVEFWRTDTDPDELLYGGPIAFEIVEQTGVCNGSDTPSS